MEQERLGRLEAEVIELRRRVAVLERENDAWEPARVVGDVPERRAIPSQPPPQPAPALHAMPLGQRLRLTEGERLEDLFGGRVLAWVGGAAVLLGVVFLLAIAVSSGWLGESARTLLAAVASGGLLVAGAWLQERRGRGDAARAAAAAGIAGLFATVVVATQAYALVPVLSGTALAILLGALATGLAIRWSSRGIAALGILGAIGAPLLTGAGHDGGVIALLFVALAAAAGVLQWRRWDWLGLAAFALAAPQWVAYLFDGATIASATLVLIAFGALAVVMAVGHDLRAGASGLRSQQAFLLVLNAIVLAGAGWFAFGELGSSGSGTAWLVGLAAVHLLVGLFGPRLARISHELRMVALTLGVLLADVAFALLAHGWVQAAGWSAAAVAFAALGRAMGPRGRDSAFVQHGLGGHIALSLVQTFVVADPLEVLAGAAVLSGAGAAAVAVLAASCLVAGRLVGERETPWRAALDAAGLVSVALLSVLALDGVALALAWAGEGLVLTRIARRFNDRVAGCGALGFLALSALHALVFEAPPGALTEGLDAPLAALGAVGAAAALALVVGEWLPGLAPRIALALHAGAAIGLLHLASGLLVTAFAGEQATGGALLTPDQLSQLVLSVFWALVGVVTLVAGLRRDVRSLRIGGLALLGVTVLKVFLLDLATLTSVYRVGSFVGLGLLLLAAAFLWQRLRPREEVA